MNERLIEFIKKHIEIGHDTAKIKQVLVNAGHDIAIVEEHINHVIKSKKNRKENKIYIIMAAFAVIAAIAIIVSVFEFSNLSLNKKTVSTYNESREAEIKFKNNLDIFNKALMGNDTSVCNKIGDENLKNECRNNFLAINASNQTAGAFCNQECIDKNLINKALINNNLSICSEIRYNTIRSQCEQILMKR